MEEAVSRNGRLNLDAVIRVRDRLVTHRMDVMDWPLVPFCHNTTIGESIVRVERTRKGIDIAVTPLGSRRGKHHPNVEPGYYKIEDGRMVPIRRSQVIEEEDRRRREM
ncbi:MAG: hypothetical protein A3C03_01535 [Candidatus Colwellbacteria bacterium RIFCSPHIGHO2_02_FULL_45_17]|nr:MAG: hypothetical protein A3C03_01535 [Candidatus Colwellbacteria bacterium RIFCSPHIGHO2_02_FULL_45_17]